MNKFVSWLLWPMTGGLKHEEVQNLASDYVDGSLSGAIAARFRMHLRSCHKCNFFVATLRATILTIRDLPLEDGPTDLPDRIQARLRGDEQAGPQGRQPA